MIIEGKQYDDNRQKLSDVLPIASPYVVEIFPWDVCNFKCFYCVQSQGAVDRTRLALDSFRKIIDDLAGLGHYKQIYLCGSGEPLLHPDIVKMVSYVSNAKIADSVDIVSNGSLLTKELSDSLLDAGLDRLRISLQGITDEDYQKSCGVKISVDSLIENIRYFRRRRDQGHYPCKVQIKIMEEMIRGREALFYERFTDTADDIRLEHLSPYNALENENLDDYQSSKYGMDLGRMEICPMAFYRMHIKANGDVFPCCTSTYYDDCLGNAIDDDIRTIWHGEKHKKLLLQLLKKEKVTDIRHCNGCHDFKYLSTPADCLDNHIDKLIEKYEQLSMR